MIDINLSTIKNKIKHIFSNHPDKVLRIVMLIISLISLLFAIVFWAREDKNTSVLFGLFSCGVCAYGIITTLMSDDF